MKATGRPKLLVLASVLAACVMAAQMSAAAFADTAIVAAQADTRASAYSYVDISCLPQPDVIEDGATYVFTANITNSSSLADAKAERMLGASGERPRENGYNDVALQQVTYSKEVNRADAAGTNIILSEDYSYEFYVKKADSMDGGNQGYTLENRKWAQYLDVRQDLQREIQNGDSWGTETGYYESLSASPIDFRMYPTQPFVCLTNTPRIWYWDSVDKEFYTYYSTPSCDYLASYWGNVWTMGLGYDASGLTCPFISISTAGKIAELIWLHKMVYNTHQSMGIYDQGFGIERCQNFSGDWNGLTESSFKLVLKGVNASNKKLPWDYCCASLELHDPAFWARYRVNNPEYEFAGLDDSCFATTGVASTATLGVYNYSKMYDYDGSVANSVKYADFEKLKLYKACDPLTIKFNSNNSSGAYNQLVRFYYTQIVDYENYSATPVPGAEFLGWSKSKDGPVLTGTYRATVSEMLYARWKYNVSVGPDSVEHGSVSVVGPASFDGNGKLENGQSFTATAVPSPGWLFAGWKLGNSIISTDPTYEFTCNNHMAITAVFQSVKDTYGEHWSGEGFEGNPFVISDDAGWGELVQFVAESPVGSSGSLHFALGDDIAVTTMVGTSEKPFSGTFDGGGKTLAFNCEYPEGSCAPFAYTENVAFKNLHVSGKITTDKQFAAGLVAVARGTTTLTNCRSSIEIDSRMGSDGAPADGTHGGFVAEGATVVAEGCVFDGSIEGANTAYCAGFVGSVSNNEDSDCINCVFDAQQVSTYGNTANFIRTSDAATNCYYTWAIGQGRDRGKLARTVTAAEGVLVAFGEGAEYDVSGITSYAAGLSYKGAFIAGKGDMVSFTAQVSSTVPMRCIANAGKLVEENGAYKLTMPDQDVTIGAAIDVQGAKVVLSKTSFAYNAKTQKPTVKTIGGEKLALGTDYSMTIKNSKGSTVTSPKAVGTYTVIVTGKGSYTGTAKATYKITKAANPLSVKAKTASVKYSKLKSKARVLSFTSVVSFVKKGQGRLSYAKLSGNKKITVNKKTGKVSVAKGLAKGIYKVKAKVKAAGNANYNASAWKKVTFKVKVA